MPLNDFLPFALGAGSNVMPQAEYDALVARVSGFSSGTAKSRELNKVWRQSAFAVSCIAQFMADYTGNDILDDGDETGFKANLAKAIAMLSMGTDYAVGSNTGNAYSASFTPAVTSLVDGMVLRFKAGTANTGPSTFAPNGLEAKPIVNMKYAALAAGDIQEGGEIWLQYNSSVLGGAWVSILSLGISEASTTVKGIVELATDTETQEGTDAAKAVTAAGLASVLSGKQDADATLSALAELVVAANKLIYATGADTFATTDLTAFARTLLDDADAAAARVTLGVLTPIGEGQSWQDVTASRTRATTYTNTTGRPIMVSITAKDSGTQIYMNLWLGGLKVAEQIGGGGAQLQVTAIVPPGVTYKVERGDTTDNITGWMELR